MDIETGKIYNEDCMETMERMDDNEIDLVLTDPPYGIDADDMEMGSGEHDWDKDLDNWDFDIPSEECFNEIFRVSQNQMIFGGNFFTDYLPVSNHWLIWDKQNPNLSFSEAELVWCSFGDRIRIHKEYSANKDKKHPTQKPVELIMDILNSYVEDDWLIYDPFTGSGSIPIACERFGVEWLASELEYNYVEKARERVKRERDQRKMF